MKAATQHEIQLGGRRIYYRIVRSRGARKLRVRVGPSGVQVLQPVERYGEDVSAFLNRNETWILDQLERAERLRGVRRPAQRRTGEILFRGEPTPVRVQSDKTRRRSNLVDLIDGTIVVRCGTEAQTPIARSLENWLRKQARTAIDTHLTAVSARIGRRPRRVYVMGQRTKWGNCSALRNLSFNWRLIQAPDFVLRYLVTHEAVHLAIPDHSAKFWLTVQSLCRETERAKQWLCTYGHKLNLELSVALNDTSAR